MGNRCLIASRFDLLPFLVQHFLGELAHKAATDPLSDHGTWSQRMSDMLVDTVGVAMIVGMAVRMTVGVIVAV